VSGPVARPDGSHATQYADDVWLVESGGVYTVEAAGCPPIPLDADVVARAAWGLPNLVAAVVHAARRTPVDDDVTERLAAMLAAGLRLVRREREPLLWEGEGA
jgi:hypothetical protein